MIKNEDNSAIEKNATNFSFKNKIIIIKIISIVIGIIGGYLYYFFVGCNSGGCLISSNPYISVIWGAVFGYFVSDFFVPKKKSTAEEEKN